MNEKLTKKYFEGRRLELEEAYNQIKPDWQELADFFLPRSVRFLVRNVNKSPAKNKKIKDSTTLKAVRDFSSGMMTGATNPAQNWFRLRIHNYDMKYDWQAKEWCSSVEEIMRNIFQSSDLYKKLPSAYKQLGVFGISALALEADEETVLRTKLLPVGSYRIARNEKGEVDTIARVYMESARNLYDKFGENSLSNAALSAFRAKRFNEMFEIVHFVEPNRDYIPGSKWAKNKKFISVYYEVAGDHNKFLNISGFDKFPYIVFEGETLGEDTYPCECCGMNALPDAKQLMAMVVDEGKIIKKIASPQLKGPAELKNKKLIDAPATFTENNQNGEGLTPIYQIPPQVLTPLENLLEIKRNSIKELFFNDLFAMILNTAQRGRTATEVNELKEEKMVLLSPLLEQVHSALKQIMSWVFNECYKRKMIPEPPLRLRGRELEIEFVSMLAQAQKAARVAGIERFTTFTVNLANSVDQNLVMKLNGEKIIDDYADFINLSPEQIVSNEEYEKKKEENNQKIEAEHQTQIQMEQLKKGTEMIKNMGGVDSFGSELLSRLGMI